MSVQFFVVTVREIVDAFHIIFENYVFFDVDKILQIRS